MSTKPKPQRRPARVVVDGDFVGTLDQIVLQEMTTQARVLVEGDAMQRARAQKRFRQYAEVIARERARVLRAGDAASSSKQRAADVTRQRCAEGLAALQAEGEPLNTKNRAKKVRNWIERAYPDDKSPSPRTVAGHLRRILMENALPT